MQNSSFFIIQTLVAELVKRIKASGQTQNKTIFHQLPLFHLLWNYIMKHIPRHAMIRNYYLKKFLNKFPGDNLLPDEDGDVLVGGGGFCSTTTGGDGVAPEFPATCVVVVACLGTCGDCERELLPFSRLRDTFAGGGLCDNGFTQDEEQVDGNWWIQCGWYDKECCLVNSFPLIQFFSLNIINTPTLQLTVEQKSFAVAEVLD